METTTGGRKQASRERAVDACDVANDLVGDFITATNVLRHYRAQRFDEMLMVGIQRMCMAHMVLACSKFQEFYEKFGDMLSDAYRAEAKTLLKEFRRRRVGEFRNKVIGHIWDKDRDRPLYLSEVNQHVLDFVAGDEIETFLDWIDCRDSDGRSVCFLLNAIREDLASRFAISAKDVMTR